MADLTLRPSYPKINKCSIFPFVSKVIKVASSISVCVGVYTCEKRKRE